MTAARLLSFRDRLLELEESPSASDIQDERELTRLDPELIYFKSDARWRALYDAVKAQLAGREHVPR